MEETDYRATRVRSLGVCHVRSLCIYIHIYIYLWFGSVRLTPRTENHKLQEESEGCLGSDLEAACNAHLPQIQALP